MNRKQRLILASRSPRRRELLANAGAEFEWEAAKGKECFDRSLPIDQALIQVAAAKALEVFKKHPKNSVLAADTIVYDQNRVLGKPENKEEALAMLQSLSGRWHEVKTAAVLLDSSQLKAKTFTTRVHFRALSNDEIEAYVDQGSCFDKAGSYGIQEVDFVDGIDGSYSNVVGLPVEEIMLWLKEDE